MLEGLITSQTRRNLLVRLFRDPGRRGYLRGMAAEFGVSTNAVRTELNHLVRHGFLVAEREAGRVFYRANPAHPFFGELVSMVGKLAAAGPDAAEGPAALAPASPRGPSRGAEP
ncbi:MAG: hypothetical protein Kow0092_03550 [Deferrisomatales bacterium]